MEPRCGGAQKSVETLHGGFIEATILDMSEALERRISEYRDMFTKNRFSTAAE